MRNTSNPAKIHVNISPQPKYPQKSTPQTQIKNFSIIINQPQNPTQLKSNNTGKSQKVAITSPHQNPQTKPNTRKEKLPYHTNPAAEILTYPQSQANAKTNPRSATQNNHTKGTKKGTNQNTQLKTQTPKPNTESNHQYTATIKLCKQRNKTTSQTPNHKKHPANTCPSNQTQARKANYPRKITISMLYQPQQSKLTAITIPIANGKPTDVQPNPNPH